MCGRSLPFLSVFTIGCGASSPPRVCGDSTLGLYIRLARDRFAAEADALDFVRERVSGAILFMGRIGERH